MPARLPKGLRTATVRGIGAGSSRDVHVTVGGIYDEPRTPLKSRVGQAMLYHFVAGAGLLLMAIITESQYGWAIRFRTTPAGLSLKAVLWIISVLHLVLGLYTFGMWWLDRVHSEGWFHCYGFMAVADTLFATWAIVICGFALFSSGANVVNSSLSFSTGQRTMLIILTILLLINFVLSLSFTIGTIQYWRTEHWREPVNRSAGFAGVQPSAPPASAVDTDEESSDDDDEADAKALPAPGQGGKTAKPMYFAAAKEEPKHDEHTRMLFTRLWQSMKETGHFECGVSQVPQLPQLIAHLRSKGFQPLMTGDDGTIRKIYLYAEETIETTPSMVFVAEFLFSIQTKKLNATFKAHDAAHMEYVKHFHLEELFTAVA